MARNIGSWWIKDGIDGRRIEGTVSEGKRGIAFNFARHHHAAPPAAYAAADLAGPWLTANPDGITPLQKPARR